MYVGEKGQLQTAQQFPPIVSYKRSNRSISDKGLPMADAEDEAGGGAPLPIRENLLQEILLSGASHETRANPQALALTSALVGSFVEECWHRSAAEAEEVGDAVDIRG